MNIDDSLYTANNLTTSKYASSNNNTSDNKNELNDVHHKSDEMLLLRKKYIDLKTTNRELNEIVMQLKIVISKIYNKLYRVRV